ncbi:ankyrin repeat domain family member sosondowah [Oratosquilla oratoria]|uniref:ankyrin repeat domain family member sosondowah n=1 Tax=Oratosquilla oratoria TaxID=337810 RepID=UPI003F75C426
MAAPPEEFTLEAVRDYMISNGGRVTNHDLVKYFKVFLTNPETKEISRHKFKQYVNTLATISQEGGEKFLVLKRKYRIGTALSESEFLASNSSGQCGNTSQSDLCNTSSSSGAAPGGYSAQSLSPGASPGHPSPLRAPPYRAPPPYSAPPPYNCPPPYRPPPSPGSPSLGGNGESRYPSDSTIPLSPSDQRFPGYDEPSDLGIPPAPQGIRSSGSVSSLSSASSGFSAFSTPSHASSGPTQGTAPSSSSGTASPSSAPLRPKSLALSPSSSELDSGVAAGGDDSTCGSSLSTATVTPLSNAESSASTPSPDGIPPPIPPRKRSEKENQRPSPEGEETSLLSKAVSSTSLEDEQKVSVREAMQKFNRMASESQLQLRHAARGSRNSRADRDDEDALSINSYGAEGQEWLVASAKSDFNEILRLLKIHPTLAGCKDLANGYTALHWAAKHGRAEVVKLLAGTHQVDVCTRSNGGYTPLHIAAMYNRHDVFDLLSHYGADTNLRDYSGKKPRQYSMSTIPLQGNQKLAQRRNSVKEASTGFLRIGSLNVKVRKTTEAFNQLLSRDSDAKLHRAWGSSDSIHDADKDNKSMMPPPKFGPIKKRKTKKGADFISRPVSLPQGLLESSTPSSTVMTTQLPPINADSDSDSAYGFGSEWH